MSDSDSGSEDDDIDTIRKKALGEIEDEINEHSESDYDDEEQSDSEDSDI